MTKSVISSDGEIMNYCWTKPHDEPLTSGTENICTQMDELLTLNE